MDIESRWSGNLQTNPSAYVHRSGRWGVKVEVWRIIFLETRVFTGRCPESSPQGHGLGGHRTFGFTKITHLRCSGSSIVQRIVQSTERDTGRPHDSVDTGQEAALFAVSV